MQEAATCREKAKQKAVDYLAAEVENIPMDEVFILAITSYALSYGQKGRVESFNRLFQTMRNDCE